MGILPRPWISKGDLKQTKRIGYFPKDVLDTIETVKRLKRQGLPMDEILRTLSKETSLPVSTPLPSPSPSPSPGKGVVVTFEAPTQPAYLLDSSFRVVWANALAEAELFKRSPGPRAGGAPQSVFRVLFSWETHAHILNWRDLLAFHVSFAKVRYPKSWMAGLYEDISEAELALLDALYDEVRPFPEGVVRETPLSLVMEGGSITLFRVFSIYCREGLILLYGRDALSGLLKA